jgi:undecaprenyl-diphosphatase
MSPLSAVLLGLVEGLTEYLPISSTGHLILVGRLLRTEGEAAKAFEIVIQLGAILAVVIHYRALLRERVLGLVKRRPEAVRLIAALIAGFLPTMATGLLLHKAVKAHLFKPLPVALALMGGGFLMIFIEVRERGRRWEVVDGLDRVYPSQGFLIGLGQCFSLWPGASRSMCTIVAGQLCGFSRGTAAEFSFLLALPTLGAATLYEGWKARGELLAQGGGRELAIGLVVSFLVAWAVIALFLRYLRRFGLAPFGYYRIVLGASVLLLFR